MSRVAGMEAIRASVWQSPGGARWVVTHRWTGGHGGPAWVRLRSLGGATRKMLARDLEREWKPWRPDTAVSRKDDDPAGPLVTRGHVYTPPTTRRTPKPRCCAACKTPYNCGNGRCRCHQTSPTETPRSRSDGASRVSLRDVDSLPPAALQTDYPEETHSA